MKLNYKRTILIGFAFMAISGFWQVYDNIIPLILIFLSILNNIYHKNPEGTVVPSGRFSIFSEVSPNSWLFYRNSLDSVGW